MQVPDLLIPLWSTHGRDFEALLPVVWYCEKKLGLTVALRSMFDVHQVHRLRPRAILISSSTGSLRCVDLVRSAYACNIPTTSLTAEGDFKEDLVEQMFWGLNADRFLYEDLNLQWSERARQMILTHYPGYAHRIRTSGAAGFDRYKIYEFMSRGALLEQYASRSYDMVIGYAGYGFDRLQMPKLRPLYLEMYGKAGVEQMERDRGQVNRVLGETIHSHPNVLFVLKYHPGTLDEAKTELYKLDHLQNVIVLRKEETIADIISACDLWTVYDSTTALEAWLLDKPTLVINPSGPDFMRSQIYRGSGVVRTVEELSQVIAEWLDTRQIERFELNAPQRRQLVCDTIQWDDGLNHVRVANVVAEMLESSRPYKRPALGSYLHWWGVHQLIRLAYVAPQLVFRRRLKRVPQLFSWEELAAMQDRYYPQLAAFHEQLDRRDYEKAKQCVTNC